MVGKIVRLFHKEINGLHQAAYLLAFFSILSQLLALFRDRLFAYMFGAGQTLDLYYAAFRIPDFVFITIASMVSISVLIPFLTDRQQAGTREVKEFINHSFSLFFTTIAAVSAVLFFLVPYIIPFLFPGFASGPEKIELIHLTRIILLSPIFLGCSNFFANITQLHNRFILSAVSPLLYNGSIIAGTLFLYPIWGMTGVAIGVVSGALLHWLIQVPFAIKQNLFPSFVFKIKKSLIARPVLLSLPRTLTLSSSQLVMLVLVSLASIMAPGSISIFTFAMNLQSVPYSIVGGSYSAAAFPTLSKHFAAGRRAEFLEQMITSARHIIFWSMPVVALFIVLRAQIVRTILGSGAFSWADTRLTAACLALFAISLVAQSLTLLFVRAYYAEGKTKKPVIVTIISSLLTIASALVMIWFTSLYPEYLAILANVFRVGDIANPTVLILALAFSFGSFVNCLLHWWLFRADFPGFTRKIIKTFLQTLIAAIGMGFVTYYFLGVFDDIFALNTLFGIFMQGLLAGISGIIVGIGILYVLKNEELAEIGKTLHSKIWKAKVSALPEERVI